MTLRSSYQSSGSATWAFVAFTVFYVVAALVTRTVYLRRPTAAPGRAVTGRAAAGGTDAAEADAASAAVDAVPAAR
jgi:NNP family nitrate/nitrite transporter-like MFS transporter